VLSSVDSVTLRDGSYEICVKGSGSGIGSGAVYRGDSSVRRVVIEGGEFMIRAVFGAGIGPATAITGQYLLAM
jgi:hypothetical protein